MRSVLRRFLNWALADRIRIKSAESQMSDRERAVAEEDYEGRKLDTEIHDYIEGTAPHWEDDEERPRPYGPGEKP